MRLDIRRVIELFDEPFSLGICTKTTGSLGSHVSAITSLIGEDLVIGCLLHFLRKKGFECKIESYTCKRPGKAGNRLDAWISYRTQTENYILQVEVKNWSGHSLPNYELPFDADLAQLADFSKPKWNHFFSDPDHPPGLEKALLDMDPPDGCKAFQRKKAVAFWCYLVPPDLENPAEVPLRLAGGTLSVFSASRYLREICDTIIELEMPRVPCRLNLIHGLLPGSD